MGILINQLEAQERLSSPQNLSNRVEVRTIIKNLGNSNGDKGRGIEEQVRAASLARVIGNKKAAAATGYCERQVANLRHAIPTGIAGNINEELKEQTHVMLKEVRDESVKKLMLALGVLTEDKLRVCNARDVSIVASNMSKIMERTLPRQENSNNLNLVIYAPRQREMKDFNVVEI